MLPLLVLCAHARDASPGLLLPGAAEGGTSVGLELGTLPSAGGEISPVPGLSGQLTLGRLTIEARLPVAFSPYGAAATPMAGASYRVLAGPHLAVAPFVFGGGLAGLDSFAEPPAVVMAGVAVEGGSEHVRIDASLPLLSWSPGGPLAQSEAMAPLASSVGLSVRVTERDRLRFGYDTLCVTVGLRHDAAHWYAGARAGLASFGFGEKGLQGGPGAFGAVEAGLQL